MIDSLSGFEVALAPTYRVDFRESLYRLVGALTATGVTVLMTAEVSTPTPAVGYVGAGLVHHRRHHRAALRRDRRSAPKGARGGQDARSEHATDFRTYRLTPEGAIIGESLSGYHGITTGVPDFVDGMLAMKSRSGRLCRDGESAQRRGVVVASLTRHLEFAPVAFAVTEGPRHTVRYANVAFRRLRRPERSHRTGAGNS